MILRSAIACLMLIAAAIVAADNPPTTAPATQPAAAAPASRFAWVDIYVDSGQTPLAAYQVELTSRTGNMNVVGIEGGDHAAFAEPPFHDRIAIIQNRVILAAYSTADELPAGSTRVARVMVELRGSQPMFDVKLIAAGGADAQPIQAEVRIREGVAR